MAKFATLHLAAGTDFDRAPLVHVAVYHVVAVQRFSGSVGQAGAEAPPGYTGPTFPVTGCKVRTSTGEDIIVFETPAQVEAALNAAADTGWSSGD